jgi:arylsulfatase A-like enzyme
MAKRTYLREIVLVCLVAGCRPSAKVEDRLSDDPNVFVVVLDTLRYDRVGPQGEAPSLTPSLDRFAKGALVYRRAYAQSSWTKTSVASLLTGVYPYRHGVYEELIENGRLPKAADTLAERLRARGYMTFAASMNPHVSEQAGFGQGFAEFAQVGRWQGNDNSRATDAAIRYLHRVPRHRPQLVYVHYLDPHGPWPARRRCGRALARLGVKTANRDVLSGSPYKLSGEHLVTGLGVSGTLPTPLPLSAGERRYLETLYDCEVSVADRAFGELTAYLARHGWLKNALVVVTADHGEEFWEHGMLRHGYQVYDETVHVPLIVKPPSGMKIVARAETGLALHVDIPATIYAILGMGEKEGALDGESLLARAGAPSPDGPGRAFGVTRFRKQHRTYLIENEWKVINDFKSNRCELYNLREDRLEKRPVRCEASGKGEKMRAALLKLKEKSEARAYAKDSAIGPEDGVLEQLKELGYVQ